MNRIDEIRARLALFPDGALTITDASDISILLDDEAIALVWGFEDRGTDENIANLFAHAPDYIRYLLAECDRRGGSMAGMAAEIVEQTEATARALAALDSKTASCDMLFQDIKHWIKQVHSAEAELNAAQAEASRQGHTIGLLVTIMENICDDMRVRVCAQAGCLSNGAASKAPMTTLTFGQGTVERWLNALGLTWDDAEEVDG